MLPKPKKRWNPSIWASWKPFGLGEQYPNNYWEVLRAIWENRDSLPYVWEILNQGVCDGCALGTTGMKDWTVEGLHLCNMRLRLLRLNTISAFNPQCLADVSSLKSHRSQQLREMGRLPYPMRRDKGDKGFRRISWDEALDCIADRIRATTPDRTSYYLTSRGTVNETYYVTQKAVRGMGTNNIDNAARVCHSPSTTALKTSLGIAATTCSYKDWIGTDLLVFIGSNVANNQPVTVKYLHWAKKAGTRIVMINSYREPGMERYWVPSIPESALFGTKFAEDCFLVNVGGDMAFLNGTLKHIIENNWTDANFINHYTTGFNELKDAIDSQSWEQLEHLSGATQEQMYAFAQMVGKAQKAVFVWSTGITQHTWGEDNVRAIINLVLTKGFVGREGCGLMPIRGHSGVQGGAEMGCYATVLPGGKSINPENAASLGQQWGFEVPTTKGLMTSEMIEAAAQGKLDLLFSVGGNFLEVLPDPDYGEMALKQVPYLKEAGDQFQYGGSHLCFGWNFPMPFGKAKFTPLSPPEIELPEGYFVVATRRGKQFNSMVQEHKDGITGAVREAIFMSPLDVQKWGLKEGDRLLLKSESGEYQGRVHTAPIQPSNLQVHWPEGNGLLDKHQRSPGAGIPNYNAIVRLEKVED